MSSQTTMALSPLWILTVGLLLVLSYFFSFLKNYLRCIWLVVRLPGPFAWPIIGNAHWAVDSKSRFIFFDFALSYKFFLGLISAAVDCPKKYGLIIRAWLSFYPIVFILDPAHIQVIPLLNWFPCR